MIDVKTAVQNATESMRQFIPDATDLALEEVELTEDDKKWFITLSALVPRKYAGSQFDTSMAGLLGSTSQRIYKIFTIDPKSGSVRSMKIRQVA